MLRYYSQPVPTSCHLRGCKAPLSSIVSVAISSELPFTFNLGIGSTSLHIFGLLPNPWWRVFTIANIYPVHTHNVVWRAASSQCRFASPPQSAHLSLGLHYYHERLTCYTTGFKIQSDGDAIAVLCMHVSVVWHHPINKQSWILCIFYLQCQLNKVDRMFISTTYLRQIIVFVLDLEWVFLKV